MNPNYQKHFPVMLPEVLKYLAPQDGQTYVDATFGNGGYSEAILQAADCKVIALDRDPTVKPRAEELKEKFKSRFEFRAGKFGDFATLIDENIQKLNKRHDSYMDRGLTAATNPNRMTSTAAYQSAGIGARKAGFTPLRYISYTSL